MEMIEGIKSRRSIRKFLDKKIEHKVIEEIVEATSYSPSWKNTQVVRYTVIENKSLVEELGRDCVLGFSFNEKTMNRAAAVVVVSYEKGISGFEPDGSYSTPREDKWETFDAGIATQTFCLAAYEKGVGSVILGVFDEDKVKEKINLGEEQGIAALIAIGYPEVTPNTPPRKKTDDLLTFI